MRSLLAILAYLLGIALAGAQQPACQGEDLLAQLEAADPVAHAVVLREAAAIPNGSALFWRIERDGAQPSFLLGTAHLTDPRVTELRPAAQAALENAATVALELVELQDFRQMALAMMRNAALMVLPPGQSLWDLVPDADEAAIRDNVNLPPGTAEGLYGYQPWLVATMLSIPLCETQRKQQGLDVLDSLIGRIATERGIPLVGLETVEEQLSAFAAMPIDMQVRYLIATAKLGPAVADHFETLIRLYTREQVAAYMPLAQRIAALSPEERKIMAFVEEDLVRKRNLRMADRALSLVARGNAFIAVGALHLAGEDGLVELFRRAGYKVSPVH